MSLTSDRYGHTYLSLNGVAGFPSAFGVSLMSGWINSSNMPTSSTVTSILSEWGAGATVGAIIGVGFYGNSSGTATSVGATTPGVSVYGGYTWELPVSAPVWCN